MVNTKIDYDGHAVKYNSDGAIIIAIRPIRETGELNDLGFGMYGRFSVIDAIEAITTCTKEMFKTYAGKDNEMDYGDMKKLFRAAVDKVFPKTEEFTMTLDTQIDPEVLKAITGQ